MDVHSYSVTARRVENGYNILTIRFYSGGLALEQFSTPFIILAQHRSLEIQQNKKKQFFFNEFSFGDFVIYDPWSCSFFEVLIRFES